MKFCKCFLLVGISAVLLCTLNATEKDSVNYIYRGDFQKTQYKKGNQLQKYWQLSPWQDTSGFAIEREEEGGAPRAQLNINYSKPPKAPEGWKALKVVIDFIGVPQTATEISFKAHGEGTIEAHVYEYKLVPDASRREPLKKQYSGRAAHSQYTLNNKWETHRFTYTPTTAELGAVAMVLTFKPAASGRLNVALDEVKALAKPGASFDQGQAFLTIPRLKKAPKIDGKFSPDEWSGAIPLSGFTQGNALIPPLGDQFAWVGYDDQALYIAFQAKEKEAPKAAKRSRDKGIWNDDSIEILLASGDAKKRAHFMVNAAGSIYDANYEKEGAGSWNPEWHRATQQSSDGWQVEVAIPWKILSWRVQPGGIFRINIGQHNVIGNSTLSYLNAWALAPNGADGVSFNIAENYPKARLAADSPAAGVELSYDSKMQATLKLKALNPSGKPSKLVCTYGRGGLLAGRIELNGKNSEQQTIIPTKFEAAGSYVAVQVNDGAGQLVYSHREVFKSGFTSAIELNNVFPLNYVEVEVDIPLPEFVIVCRTLDAEGKQLAEQSNPGKSGVNKIKVDVSGWPFDQKRQVLVELRDNQGASISSKNFEVTRPGPEPWRNNKLGLTDKPIPPFKAIQADEESAGFLITGYTFKDSALPGSAKSGGHELLAAPATLMVKTDTVNADLADTRLKIASRKANKVEWRATKKAGALTTDWKVVAEEDGFVWYTVTLKPDKPTRIDALTLTVPLRREYATLLSPIPFGVFGKSDSDGNWELRSQDWDAAEHKQIITVMDDDRGIELTSEDARNWSNRTFGHGQSVHFRDKSADIIFRFIDKVVTIKEPVSYSFGIQAFPVKPLVRHPDLRRMTYNRSLYSYMATPKNPGSAYVKYPVKDRINLKEGTLEAWVYAGFDPQKPYLYTGQYTGWQIQEFFRLAIGKSRTSLNWDHRSNGWLFSNNKVSVHGKLNSWRKPGWHHVAVSWGDQLRIFDDGKLIASGPCAGLFGKEIGQKEMIKAFFTIGNIGGRNSAFRIGGIKISSKALKPEQMALKGDFSKNSETLLLDNFAAGDKVSGELVGTAGIGAFKGAKALVLGDLFPETRLDALGEAGYKWLLCHGAFSERHSLPYFETKKRSLAFKTFVKEAGKRGMKVIPGFSFGVGWGSRETTLYGYYWYAHPIHLCGLPQHPLGIKTFCMSVDFIHDYYCYYWDKLIKDYGVAGIYTDNTFVAGQKCNNQLHGCGWKDASGKLHQSGNLLAGRRLAKRLCALCKLRPEPVIHYAHSSACGHALYMSWFDQYLVGEQYRAHRSDKSWNINVAQYRAQTYGERFGVETHTVNGLVPFGHEGVQALALLHNVSVIDVAWRNWPRRMLWQVKLWDVMDKFGTDLPDTVFLPYWKNRDYVDFASDKRQYVTMWRRKDGVLAEIANLAWTPSTVEVRFDLKKLGLKGEFKDAFTGAEIPSEDGTIKIPVKDYNMKLLLIK